jgi:hypothetical protein
MHTECSADLFGFAPVERRAMMAGFDGGRMTSDGGALLLVATDRAIGLVRRFAECFTDSRAPELIEHEVMTLVGQRVFGIALGYEDLGDHDQLRHDAAMAVLPGKLSARRKDCAPLAAKARSTGWSWAGQSCGVPRVRIRLPPARSRLRTLFLARPERTKMAGLAADFIPE